MLVSNLRGCPVSKLPNRRLRPLPFMIGRIIVIGLIVVLGGLVAVPSGLSFVIVGLTLILPLHLAFHWPIISSRPGCRLFVASWTCLLWPLFYVCIVHIMWFVAYATLGHRPEPTDAGSLIFALMLWVSILLVPTSLAWIGCLYFSTQAIINSVLAERKLGVKHFLPFIAMPLVFLLLAVILRADPFDVVNWIIPSDS